MRVTRLLAALAAVTLFSIDAGGVAQAQEACARVRSACLAAGFRQNAARVGRGVEIDCIDPILHHHRAPPRTALPLPRVDPEIVAACLNPAAARRAQEAKAAAAAHAAASANAALPTNAAAAAANAAAPTNAPAPTNEPANAAQPANAAAPANAAEPTNAAAPSAPAQGWPMGIIAALIALAAAAAVAIFLAMRRRRPAAPHPAASAPAPAPPNLAPSSSPAEPAAPSPAAPPVVAAAASPSAAASAVTGAPIAMAAGAAAAAGPATRPHDVFISYSSEDKPVADAVCAILEQQRIRCWITPRDVLPGEEWAGAIVRAINGARVVVLIFSASSNASHQVLREIERAVHVGAMIIPFRIQDTPPSQSLEYFISTPHWLDALTAPLEQHVLRLAESIKSLLAQSPP